MLKKRGAHPKARKCVALVLHAIHLQKNVSKSRNLAYPRKNNRRFVACPSLDDIHLELQVHIIFNISYPTAGGDNPHLPQRIIKSVLEFSGESLQRNFKRVVEFYRESLKFM